MKLNIKDKLRNNRKLAGNIGYLTVIQVGNYILPLIIIPFLLRVLGTELYGLLSFALAFTTYFQFFVDFGFGLSATREVPLIKGDRAVLSTYVYSVIAAKLVFTAISGIVFAIIVLSFKPFNEHATLYMWFFVMVAGSVFIPGWLFLGMEEMGFVTLINFVNKALSTVLILFIIRSQHDYIYFASISAVCSVITGVLGFSIAHRKYRLKFVLPSPARVFDCIRKSSYIFVSQISVHLFTNTNIFILGIMTNNTVVGTFSVAEKIVRAAIYLCIPVSGAIYPKVSFLFQESRERAIRFLRTILFGGTAVFCLVSLCLFLSADYLVKIVSGGFNSDITVLIRILSVLPLSVFVDNIFGTQILLNIKKEKSFMYSLSAGGLVSVLLLVVLVPFFQARGAAISFLISQLVVLGSFIYAVEHAGISLWKKTRFSAGSP